jgi:uncharacterized protein (TIGR03437 family)
MSGRIWYTLGLASTLAFGQSAIPAADWRRVGTPAVELMLASPATGPVEGVWFSSDGSALYARTRSGKLLQTQDFDTWTPAVTPLPALAPAAEASGTAARRPEAEARLVSAAADPAGLYALGNNLFRSEDGGRSWANLTAYKAQPVVGSGQHGLAVSPRDSAQMVLANDYGVWRSMDGGLSWAGLNAALPNLPVRRILATPAGSKSIRIWAENLGALELPHGATEWLPTADPALATEAATRKQYGSVIGVAVTAVAAAAETVYAGTADGRIWVSLDSGRTFSESRAQVGGAVERIFVDAAAPNVALAALAGSGTHVLRTTNSGTFWDDLTSNLPDAPAHAVTGDRTANAVYVATAQGVFYARADLTNPGAPNVSWIALTTRLPQAPAVDVRLDAAGNQLYIALDGYGVFATLAPHRSSSLRVLNAADFSTRAAAPGSLLSVVGTRVSGVTGAGLTYPVLAASDADSQIQVPFDATGPSVALALQTRTGSVTVPLAVQPVSPAIFIGRDGSPMLMDADSGLLLDGRNTAQSNMRVQIFATGLGRVRPDWPTGVAAPLDNAPEVIAAVKAYLDRTPIVVTRATLAPGYIGFYVVEVQLPAVVNAGQAELYISAGGQESNRVQVTVEP